MKTFLAERLGCAIFLLDWAYDLLEPTMPDSDALPHIRRFLEAALAGRCGDDVQRRARLVMTADREEYLAAMKSDTERQ